jgi:hypothetical protein
VGKGNSIGKAKVEDMGKRGTNFDGNKFEYGSLRLIPSMWTLVLLLKDLIKSETCIGPVLPSSNEVVSNFKFINPIQNGLIIKEPWNCEMQIFQKGQCITYLHQRQEI